VKYDLLTAFRGVLRSYRGVTPIDLVREFSWGPLGIYFFLPFFA
jgi:hypothetical protein